MFNQSRLSNDRRIGYEIHYFKTNTLSKESCLETVFNPRNSLENKTYYAIKKKFKS